MSSVRSSSRARGTVSSTLKHDLGLVLWQIRYEQRAYWRNRGRGILTFVFPLMFLVIFASIYHGSRIHTRGGISYDDFFIPAVNPIDVTPFCVGQHYRDFLGRVPDAPGLQFWSNGIEACGSNQQCREIKRIDSGFFDIKCQSVR